MMFGTVSEELLDRIDARVNRSMRRRDIETFSEQCVRKFPRKGFRVEELPDVYFRRNFLPNGCRPKKRFSAMTYDELGRHYKCDWVVAAQACAEATNMVRAGTIVQLPNGRFALSREFAERLRKKEEEAAAREAAAAEARRAAEEAAEREREEARRHAREVAEKLAAENRKWVTSKEASEITGRTAYTIRTWANAGYLAPENHKYSASGHLLISREEMVAVANGKKLIRDPKNILLNVYRSDPDWMTAKEAIAATGCSPYFLTQWAKRELLSQQTAGGMHFYRREEIEKIARELDKDPCRRKFFTASSTGGILENDR